MLDTAGYARYLTAPGANFDVAGTTRGFFDTYQLGVNFNAVHLSVNNAGEEAYTQAVSMTPALNINSANNGFPPLLAAPLTLSAVPAINSNSPRNRVYLVAVSWPIYATRPRAR